MTSSQRIQRVSSLLAISATMVMSLSGCRVIGGIFKAGMGVGIFLVIVVLAIVGGIAALLGRGARA